MIKILKDNLSLCDSTKNLDNYYICNICNNIYQLVKKFFNNKGKNTHCGCAGCLASSAKIRNHKFNLLLKII